MVQKLETQSDEGVPGLEGDLIWGADAIAKELNLSARQAYHQLE